MFAEFFLSRDKDWGHGADVFLIPGFVKQSKSCPELWLAVWSA
jgi:hypothetical protein